MSSGGRLPNLLIAGVGKAGTTSLFWYLSQHPDICASSVKEPRYFRPPGDPASLPPIDDYLRCFRHCGSERYVMEASPQYFKGGRRTIDAIRETLPDPRIILMFRDPVDRIWSEYRFRKSRMSIPQQMGFERFVAECERVRTEGVPRTTETEPYWTLAGGFYIDHVVDWLDAFGDAIRVFFFEDMTPDPPSFLAGVCRWLDIDDRVVRSFTYSVENRSISVRSPMLQRIALRLNSRSLLRERRRVKGPLRAVYQRVNRRREGERMPPETRAHLQALFSASNAALSRELLRRGYRQLPAWLRT